MTVKIISINLCSWGEGELSIPSRMPRVSWLIHEYSPDVFGVQEATPEWKDFLKAHLKDYACVGRGRDENGAGEASAIFYKTAEFSLCGEDLFWLSETPEKLSLGWDGACRRVCTEALLKNKESGAVFAFFNTHLDHVGPMAQEQGAALINSRMKKYVKKYPVILTGDFNVSYDSKAYGRIELNDARTAAEITEEGGTWHNFGNEVEDCFKDKPIDICFVSGGVRVKSYCILRDRFEGKYITDHYPILVELDL